MILKNLLALLGICLLFFSCKKWKDNPSSGDSRLTTPYCNDPKAVNYNWDFPGVADNSVCFYPSALFSGSYIFNDSVYFADYTLDSASTKTIQLNITALDTVKLSVTGLCGNTSSNLIFSASKLYTALTDSTYYNGQIFCNSTDTVSGTFTKNRTDTTGNFQINLTVTGSGGSIKYHSGTAIKQ